MKRPTYKTFLFNQIWTAALAFTIWLVITHEMPAWKIVAGFFLGAAIVQILLLLIGTVTWNPRFLLLLRARWRLFWNHCPACNSYASMDGMTRCGICWEFEHKPDPVRKHCWLLAYKLHLQSLK
jgi:hypothetical protein